jgi:hypothetical protein
MDLSHESTILGQLRKGQADVNQRLDAIRAELQRLNVHLEQLAAALVTHQDPPARTHPARLYVSQVVSTLHPKALAISAQARRLSRSVRARKTPMLSSQPHGQPGSKAGARSRSGKAVTAHPKGFGADGRADLPAEIDLTDRRRAGHFTL